MRRLTSTHSTTFGRTTLSPLGMKQGAHNRPLAWMIRIKTHDMVLPERVMMNIKAMPIPPTGMIGGIPAGLMYPPPVKIRAVAHDRRWRTIN